MKRSDLAHIIRSAATYHPGTEERRYDLVLWVNGFPLVVGETKTPISTQTSWLNGAKDVHLGYEAKTPGFFVPNVLSRPSEGPRRARAGATESGLDLNCICAIIAQ